MPVATYYTTVSRILDRYPAIGSDTRITSSQILTAFIQPTEHWMQSQLARLYTLPMTNVPVLEGLATDLALAKILMDRLYTGQQMKDSPWARNMASRAEKMFEMIVSGESLLVNSAGTLIGANNNFAPTSNTKDYLPTFWEGPVSDNIIDEDKLDDEADARDIDRIA